MDISSLPDSDLAVYVRTREPLEFKEIIARYSSQLSRYLSFIVGNELVGLELTEEAFMETYRTLNLYSPKSSLKVFIYANASTILINYLKKHGKRQAFNHETLLDDLFEIESTETEFSDPKFISHLVKFVHKLPVHIREALVLHFLEEFSYDEVSDILKISLLAVSNRIDEGRAKILKYAKES